MVWRSSMPMRRVCLSRELGRECSIGAESRGGRGRSPTGRYRVRSAEAGRSALRLRAAPETCNSRMVVVGLSILSSDSSEDMDAQAGRRPDRQGREAPGPTLAGRGGGGWRLFCSGSLSVLRAFCCQKVARRHGDGEEESSAESAEDRRRFQGGCAGGRGSISMPGRLRLRVSPTRRERVIVPGRARLARRAVLAFALV